jgi:hypothetical protein
MEEEYYSKRGMRTEIWNTLDNRAISGKVFFAFFAQSLPY